jgi:hypothetical protein
MLVGRHRRWAPVPVELRWIGLRGGIEPAVLLRRRTRRATFMDELIVEIFDDSQDALTADQVAYFRVGRIAKNGVPIELLRIRLNDAVGLFRWLSNKRETAMRPAGCWGILVGRCNHYGTLVVEFEVEIVGCCKDGAMLVRRRNGHGILVDQFRIEIVNDPEDTLWGGHIAYFRVGRVNANGDVIELCRIAFDELMEIVAWLFDERGVL